MKATMGEGGRGGGRGGGGGRVHRRRRPALGSCRAVEAESEVSVSVRVCLSPPPNSRRPAGPRPRAPVRSARHKTRDKIRLRLTGRLVAVRSLWLMSAENFSERAATTRPNPKHCRETDRQRRRRRRRCGRTFSRVRSAASDGEAEDERPFEKRIEDERTKRGRRDESEERGRERGMITRRTRQKRWRPSSSSASVPPSPTTPTTHAVTLTLSASLCVSQRVDCRPS